MHSFSSSVAKLCTTSGEQEEKEPNKRRKIKWILECEPQNMDPNYDDPNDDVSTKRWILVMGMLFLQNDGELYKHNKYVGNVLGQLYQKVKQQAKYRAATSSNKVGIVYKYLG